MPGRLPPIPSEELEHVDDPWLDDTYERKLAWSGDDLSPIKSASSWLRAFVTEVDVRHSVAAAIGGSSAAVAMALAETLEPVVAESVELPELGDHPSKPELIAYARAHPAVIAALKIFRGKLTSVRDIRAAE